MAQRRWLQLDDGTRVEWQDNGVDVLTLLAAALPGSVITAAASRELEDELSHDVEDLPEEWAANPDIEAGHGWPDDPAPRVPGSDRPDAKRMQAEPVPPMTRIEPGVVARLRAPGRDLELAPPDPPRNGWLLPLQGPELLLPAFDRLRLREGMRLGAYIFRDNDGNGEGMTFVTGQHVDIPNPDSLERYEGWNLRLPHGFESEVMRFVEGDGSAESFLQASILRRELEEFGAAWHHIDWGVQKVVDTDDLSAVEKHGALEWRTPQPRDWRPYVKNDAGQIEVGLLVFSPLLPAHLKRVIDIYAEDSYQPLESRHELLAQAADGLMF